MAVSYQLVVARLVFMGSLDFSEMVIIAVDQRAHFFVKITAICVCMCTREIKIINVARNKTGAQHQALRSLQIGSRCQYPLLTS